MRRLKGRALCSRTPGDGLAALQRCGFFDYFPEIRQKLAKYLPTEGYNEGEEEHAMPRVDEETRRERLNRILRLLLRHPLGLREVDIAQRMGLPRRTVNDYLWSAELTGRVYKDGVLWFADPEAMSITLRPVELTPEQAVTLYLAARLLVKLHDKRNEQAETALMKLADAIRSDTDVGREVYQAVEELARRPADSAYSKVFTTVVRGYIYKRKV
ncbi:MAG TPA: hypothetical protein EYP09_00495, partial [Anaerolineae bacterium]|nr:hypothetical protein [Anaerolineae bacterium]